MTHDTKSKALTPFFRLSGILPSRVPNTQEELDVVVAIEDLDFVRSLFEADRQGLFVDTSRTLLRVGSLVSMVVTEQKVVLGSNNLDREQDKLKEKCETIEREDSTTEKELAELRAKDEVIDFL